MQKIGQSLFSIAHYKELNGDLLRDPEMVFYRDSTGLYFPVFFQQDLPPYYQECMRFEHTTPRLVNPRAQQEQVLFANMWLKNILWQQELQID